MQYFFINKHEKVPFFKIFFLLRVYFIAVGDDLDGYCTERESDSFMGRTLDWEQIAAMFTLTWLSGVLLS